MNVGQYIKELRTQKGISQEELGRIVGVKRAAVQKWECGTVTNLKRSTIKILADYFAVSPASFVIDDISDYLDSNPDKYPTPDITDDIVTFPVIGDIAAGYDHTVNEDWEGERIDIPVSYLRGRKQSEFFVLRVKGDSMYPAYHNDDIVIVLRQSTLNYSGQIGAVLYDDECATLKKVEFCQGEDWMELISINPNYPPKRIENESLEHCRILGVPWFLLRNL